MSFNYVLLQELVEKVPYGLDKKAKKEPITKVMRDFIHARDKRLCALCGKPDGDDIHHIIPNGKATPENLISLGAHCHLVVHLILYIEGRWRWVGLSFREGRFRHG